MKLHILILSMLVLLCSPFVLAKADQGDIEIITVTGGREVVKLHDSAINKDTLDKDTLELVNHQHIQQTLNRLSGVNLAKGNGQEYLPSIRSAVLTGAGACGSILTAIDDIPVRAAGFCNINELFDTPHEFAQGIEVIKGSGSVLYGSNAMNGVINIISPKIAELNSANISAEVGTHDYYRVKYNVNRPNDLPFRLDAMFTEDGGFRDDAGVQQQKVSMKYETKLSDWLSETAFHISNLNQETAGYIVGEKAYLSSTEIKKNPNPEAYRDVTSARLSTQFDYVGLTDKTIRITPYLRYTDMAFFMHFLPGTPLEQNGHTSAGVQSTIIDSLSESLEMSYGIDAELTSGYLKQTQAAATEGSAFLQATIPAGRQYDYEVLAQIVSGFVNLSWMPIDQLTLSMGVRGERTHYQYDNLMVDGRVKEDGTECGFGGCRYSRPEDGSNTFTNLSPKLSALYDLSEHSQWFVNLSHGYRAPQATELYRLQRQQTLANLDSETQIGGDMGYRYNDEQVFFAVAAYQINKENVIYRDADFFNISDGKIASKGIELDFSISFDQHWYGRLNANFADHKYKDKRLLNDVSIYNNMVDSAPEQFGNVSIGYRLAGGGQIELEWNYQGEYFTDPENLHDYDGHQVVNLYSSIDLDGYKVWLKVLNLTDERYAERADYSSFTGDRYFPGEPRRLHLGFSLSI